MKRSETLAKITESKKTDKYQRYTRFYPLKSFPHFQYVYSLVYDCYCRLKEADDLIPDTWDSSFLKPEPELVIQIDFVGTLSEERLKLISKIKGKEENIGKTVWSEAPLICFEQDIKFQNMGECHVIVVKNGIEINQSCKMDSNFQLIENDKENVRKAISVCIEKGLGDYIKKSMNKIKDLKHDAREDLEDFYLEMKSILKHVMLEENTLQHMPKETGIDNNRIPPEIIDLLFREPFVNSFGIWEDGTFKIFMDDIADANVLTKKLKSKNELFFEQFRVQIEKKKFIMKCATQLKQGVELHGQTTSEMGVECGTLGGFVRNARSKSFREAYGLTCNHLYPSQNNAAYASIDGNERKIGKCIFTTRENSCDFAVVEINEDVLDKCDFEFRRDDEKKCNAEVSEYFPINVGIVHKNGSETKWTHGRIVTSTFFSAVDRREVFVVKGLGRPFSTCGDSGSIVFARKNSLSQNTVDVLGMIYSNNPDIRDDRSHEEENSNEAFGQSERSEVGQSYIGERKFKDTDDFKRDHLQASGRNPSVKSKPTKNPENYSFCFRMNNVFQLLEREKNLHVSFEKVENSSTEFDDD